MRVTLTVEMVESGDCGIIIGTVDGCDLDKINLNSNSTVGGCLIRDIIVHQPAITWPKWIKNDLIAIKLANVDDYANFVIGKKVLLEDIAASPQ